jgi:FMN phosphatase YigB (HAD superfamily)
MSHKDVHKYIKEFNESPYIADLEPFADSVEYVERLVGKGFKFIVVTSISNAPQAKYYRTKNLINLFGDVFDEIHCLEMGISKAAELEKWSDTGYFWIEDHMRQAEAGFEAGLKTVLISHPYNSHYETDLFPKVSFKQPWKEIYNMVCKEYGLNAD